MPLFKVDSQIHFFLFDAPAYMLSRVPLYLRTFHIEFFWVSPKNRLYRLTCLYNCLFLGSIRKHYGVTEVLVLVYSFLLFYPPYNCALIYYRLKLGHKSKTDVNMTGWQCSEKEGIFEQDHLSGW